LNTLVHGAALLTVDAVMRERARIVPHRTALVEGSRRITFAELMRRVDALAQALHAMGVRRGDRIAVLSENRCEYMEALLAAGTLGAILAGVNWRLSAPELRYCVELVAPSVCLASPRHAARLQALQGFAAPAIVFGAEYEKLLQQPRATPVAAEAQPEDGLMIIYTSGTTGHPKAAVISHRAAIARALIGAVDGQFYRGRGTICWAPLYHISGCDHSLGVLMQGDTVFLTDGFQPAELVEIMGREPLGNVGLMPAAVGRVIDELKRTGIRPKGVMACGAMADLVPRHQIAEVSALIDAPFRNTFGSTETGQPPASARLLPIGEVPVNLSKIQSSYCAVRLVDENDCDVPDGIPGEVLMRGPSLFSGYWNAPDATAEAFRGGWYHMGDLMVRNPDGTLDFVDRRKYLIKSGGENIYPAEIERVLLADPRIKDAAVVRKADPHWGEIPVVFVVALDSGLAAAEVQALCRRELAGYKVPKEVHFIADEDMPRSDNTSKVQRFELEKRLQ
jgi:acyl-CoA synthetase (AMP-forming)/AMP-acid ligase II